jgi:hypothetical protein
MYNTAFIAHNILLTASQSMSLSVKCKIPYVNCASIQSTLYVYKMMGLRACFAKAANWCSGRFPLFPLDIWFCKCCSRGVAYIQPDRQTHPIRPFRSKKDFLQSTPGAGQRNRGPAADKHNSYSLFSTSIPFLPLFSGLELCHISSRPTDLADNE